jgi:hypothetical protein
MSHHPADLYLSLHDDGPVAASTAPGRRLLALLFAVLLLATVPLAWLASDAVATTGSKVTLASDDDDNSGPGGDDDDEDDTGSTTRSRSATNTENTGASTKQPTATRSNTATRTGKTGMSTKQPTGTQSKTATRTGKTGASTKA